MFYANAETARKFDKMKEQFFRNKSEQYKKQQAKQYKFDKRFSLTNSPFIKKSIIRIGILGLIYVGYTFAKPYLAMQNLILNNYADYITLRAYQALALDFQLKFKSFIHNSSQNRKDKYNKYYANQFFTSILQQDYQKMRFKINPRVIQEKIMSNWGLGFFRYKTNQSYVKIDHKGDVINEFLTSYVKIGPISLFGRKRAEIIERGKPYCYYKNSIQNTSEKSEEQRLKENCVKANSLNALTLEKNEYDHLLEYCFERSILKWKHIKDLYLRRQSEKVKKEKNKIYIIS